MCFHYLFLVICVIGTVGSVKARQADIDINRLRRLPNEIHQSDYSPINIHGRRSIDIHQIQNLNDYGQYSGGLAHAPPHSLYPAPSPYPPNTIEFHQPRENPKLYYQSDGYLRDVRYKNIQHEVAATFPGREVIRASEYEAPSLLPRRRKENRIYPVSDKCIRCPRDRTLVSKMGSDRVLLQAARPLETCSGHRVSSNVKFIHMYGPKFGSFLTRGSHAIVGRITLNGETLHLCKMEVHVIVQSCLIPKYLVAHCDELNRSCNFTCKDSRLQILGETSLACGNNMEWDNDLPVCRVRQWCRPPMPPEQGRISCKGDHVAGGAGLMEGSKCRVRCPPEWRPKFRGVAVCRRGAWTHNIQCQPKNRFSRR